MGILKRFLKNSYVEWKYRGRYISISSSAEEIGNDCWICNHVILSPNIKVADGAVVLPGAVVTKDIPPYAIVGGISKDYKIKI